MAIPRIRSNRKTTVARLPGSLAMVAFMATTLGCTAIVRAQTSDGPSATLAPRVASTPVSGPYRTWLDEDVHWVIAPSEREAYLRLPDNAERLAFIKQFWQRRNPDPASGENTFKEEHYRRLAYSNVHFASGDPGWTTDRGHIYIVYGPPDSVDAHRSPVGSAPFEVWHYRTVKDRSLSTQLGGAPAADGGFDFRFVDACKCGDYKLPASAH
ncbi:MAG TPA: GWxTD domain-containing protein [Terracidiphilus sp.]